MQLIQTKDGGDGTLMKAIAYVLIEFSTYVMSTSSGSQQRVFTVIVLILSDVLIESPFSVG